MMNVPTKATGAPRRVGSGEPAVKRVLGWPLTRVLIAVAAFFALQIGIGIGSGLLPDAWQGPLLTQTLSLAVAVAVVALITKAVERRDFAAAGVTRKNVVGGTLAGFAIGAVLVSAVVGVMALAGWYQVDSSGSLGAAAMASGLLLFLMIGIGEELLFRGVLFRILEEGLGSWLALVTVATVFGLVHLVNDNATLLGALGTGLVGIVLCAAYMLTRNLWLAIGIHWAWNLTLGLVYGLPVSGRDAGSSLLVPQVSGPETITGGAFGPEAGLLAFLVAAVTSILLVGLAVQRRKLITPRWQKPRTLLVALAALVFTAAGAQGAMPAEVTASIDAFVKERMKAAEIPGLSLVIVAGGEVAYAQGYGLADIEGGVPMTACTPVGLGSTVKSLTALAVMQLVESGQIDLDATITTYLPWFEVADGAGADITVRHALVMTTGLQDWMDLAIDPSGVDTSQIGVAHSADALEQRVRAMAELTPLSAPGEAWAYSSTGYTIAGLLIETVTGTPYETYMQEHLFAPLGMTSSGFGEVAGAAQGYLRTESGLRPEPTLQAAGYRPAGLDVFTSACDFGSYLSALLAGGTHQGQQLVSPASVTELWTPQAAIDRQRMAYGMGWYVQDWSGVTVVNHGGHAMVSGSAMFLSPERGVAVAVFANVDDPRVDALGQAIFENLVGLSAVAKIPPSTFEPDRSVWEAYVGVYETAMGVPVRLFVEDATLQAVVEGMGLTFTLEAFSDTEFVTRSEVPDADNARAEFRIDEDGTVHMTLEGQAFGVKSR